MIDLHTHTTASDGTFSFEELVRESENVGLKAIAITDHDTLRSVKKIPGAATKIVLIPGVELTVFDSQLGYKDLHVLGLFIDPMEKRINQKLKSLETDRIDQKKATVKVLRDLGYDLTFEEVEAEASGSIGRPHIAKVLLRKYPDEFDSISSVFTKLLGRGKSAYVERESGFGLGEAVSLIRKAGGLSILAHPLLYPYESRKLIEDFKSVGGDGIEVYYDYITNRPENKITADENERISERYKGFASEFGLLESGGSDFHGANKAQTLGRFGAPDSVLLRLKAASRKP